MIIDGKKISAEILEQLKIEVARLSFTPKLVDVLVGNDPVTESYVKIKAKRAAEIGIDFEILRFDKDISERELREKVQAVNKFENICGVIVQLPLPEHLDKQRILDCIDQRVDVDMISTKNSKAFYSGESRLFPPTAAAILRILEKLEMDLNEKNILVVGAGDLVGKPVAYLLNKRRAVVTVVDNQTKDLVTPAKHSDIIISGAGVSRLITSKMVNQDTVVIDAGTAESAGGISGDADFENIKDLVKAITPVPGGVGPVTVAMLLKNVVEVAKSPR
jgi:methylenetetrahydrofolate dehydrogenase (NADP+)/methenyltetrahydrofolate cyclohydrolase